MMFEYTNERAYIVNYLMNDVLLLHVNEDVYADGKYCFKFGNRVLEIQDAFFSKWGDENYLSKTNIPKDISWFDSPYDSKWKIPIIYGENKLVIQKDYVYCGLDVFASSFFMLTRWEEMFLSKDKFGRCDESEMFVVKHNIYNIPVVNEYIELLRRLLQCIGVDVKKSNRKFQAFITHDVDDLFRYASLKNLCKNLAGDLLHRKSLKEFFHTFRNYACYRLGYIKDPFDTFDELMDASEPYGFRNAFYFMPSAREENDARYDINDFRIKKIIENILNRGHEVGIHPSKNTFLNDTQFEKELDRLKRLCPNVSGGRQHYLLYSIPLTIQCWNNAGLMYDSGIGFAFRGGFRCGICYPYPFYNVLKRERCNIYIRPMIVMDTAVIYADINVDRIEDNIKSLVDVVSRYDGEFVFLWHTDGFYRAECKRVASIYFDILKYINQQKGA